MLKINYSTQLLGFAYLVNVASRGYRVKFCVVVDIIYASHAESDEILFGNECVSSHSSRDSDSSIVEDRLSTDSQWTGFSHQLFYVKRS